jgi:hypothetical protein
MVNSVSVLVEGVLGLFDEFRYRTDWSKVMEESREYLGERGFEGVDTDPTAVLGGRGDADRGEVRSEGRVAAADAGEGQFGGQSRLVLEDCGFERMRCGERYATGVKELVVNEWDGESLR